MKRNVAASRPPLATAALLGVLAISSLLLWTQPLFLGKLVPQADHITHLRWSHQFYVALSEGWLRPRWAFASHHGLGDPTFLYYPPLLYYFTAAFRFAGFSAEKALLVAAWLPYLLLALFVHQLARKAASPPYSLAAALLAITSPALFFLSTHYVALAWVLAQPFVLLFAAQSLKDKPDPFLVAITIALVCLAHTLSALMILLAVGGARFVIWLPGRASVDTHLRWVTGTAVGLGLSAFYLYPALTLQALINPGGWTEDPTLDWRRAFAFPVATYLQYGFRWFSIQWPLPLLALSMMAFVWLYSRRSRASRNDEPAALARRLATVALVGLVLSSELAYPLYASIAPLQMIQWPYRFVVQSLVLATVAVGLLLSQLGRRMSSGIIGGAIVAVHVAMAAYLQYSILTYGKPAPNLHQVLRGEFGQPEYVPSTRGEQWKAYLAAGGLEGDCESKHAVCETLLAATHDRKWRIALSSSATIVLPLFAFPAWNVTVNQEPAVYSVDPRTGLLAVTLQPGEHEVAVTWAALPQESVGAWVTALTLLLLAAAHLIRRRRESPRRDSS